MCVAHKRDEQNRGRIFCIMAYLFRLFADVAITFFINRIKIVLRLLALAAS